MERTTLCVVAVASLALVAGCAGFGAGDASTPTPTATPTQEPTPTATATPPANDATPSDGEQYPNGWSGTGVVDPDAALTGHYRATLTGPSATVSYRSRILETTANGTANTTLSMRIDPGVKRLYADINGSDTHREAFFSDGNLSQWSVENRTVVDRSPTEFTRAVQLIDQRVLKSHLLLYALERNGTVDRAGTTALVYSVTGVPNDTVSPTYGTATGASGRIVVGADGRVIEIETTVTYTEGTVTYHYGHTAIGETTVETPGWD